MRKHLHNRNIRWMLSPCLCLMVNPGYMQHLERCSTNQCFYTEKGYELCIMRPYMTGEEENKVT